MKTDLYLVLLVGLGGFLGAIARYGVTETLSTEEFPYGTLAVNLVGSLLLGILVFAHISTGIFSGEWRLFLGMGFLGAFTTMSTFNAESMSLLDNSQHLKFVFNILLNVGGGICMVYLGRAVALAATS